MTAAEAAKLKSGDTVYFGVQDHDDNRVYGWCLRSGLFFEAFHHEKESYACVVSKSHANTFPRSTSVPLRLLATTQDDAIRFVTYLLEEGHKELDDEISAVRTRLESQCQ